jgi:uncharacterized protein (TIGR02147 family)
VDRELAAQLADDVKPSSFLDYRLYLAALYAYVKNRSASYSYQKFADDLGFGPTTVMHQIIRGHRPLTAKAAMKVVKALALTGVERRFLLALVAYDNERATARREELFQKLIELKSELLPTTLDKDTLEYFSEWYHPVLRELVGHPSFVPDPEAIAATIVPRLRPEQVRESLALLERLGYIAFDAETRRWRQTRSRVTTGPRVRGMAFTRYHQKMIELGREALTRIPSHRRDVSGLTVSVDETTARKLREMIHAFQTQLLDAAEKSPGEQVYQINIQLFPFTGDGKRGKS